MKNKYFLIIVMATAITIISCKKNGTGGKATIVAFPQHHGKAIYGATMYVKFGATDLPSDPTNNYNLKIVGEPNEEHVHIENLLYGKYFIYAVGYDSAIHQNVIGGIAAKLKWSERKKEVDINVPVSE